MLDRRALLAAPLLLVLPRCGGDDPDQAPGGPPLASGKIYAQEVWVPYHDPLHTQPGTPYVAPRKAITAARAEQIASAAREEVLAGVSIGYVASRTSSAPWGRLGGYTGALPARVGELDVRDKAVLALRGRTVSPLYQWRAGFGFAMLIDAKQMARFERRIRAANHVRARARVIHIHHADAHPNRHEFKDVTPEHAIYKARSLIKQVEQGADFAALAREHSNAESTRRTGGLLKWTPAGSNTPTEWVTWRANWWHYDLYVALFEDAPVGRVMPTPVVSPVGVDLVYVLERETG